MQADNYTRLRPSLRTGNVRGWLAAAASTLYNAGATVESPASPTQQGGLAANSKYFLGLLVVFQ
jgi:hypothetical protein